MSDPYDQIRSHIREQLRRNYHAYRDCESDRERAYREALEKIANADSGEGAEDLILMALNALIDGENTR